MTAELTERGCAVSQCLRRCWRSRWNERKPLACRCVLHIASAMHWALAPTTHSPPLVTIVDYHGLAAPVSTSARALVLSCGGDGSEPLENAGDARPALFCRDHRNMDAGPQCIACMYLVRPV